MSNSIIPNLGQDVRTRACMIPQINLGIVSDVSTKYFSPNLKPGPANCYEAAPRLYCSYRKLTPKSDNWSSWWGFRQVESYLSCRFIALCPVPQNKIKLRAREKKNFFSKQFSYVFRFNFLVIVIAQILLYKLNFMKVNSTL